MKLFLLLYLCFPLLLCAQQVQWAHQVLSYSSDLGGKINSVKRLLGKPDAFPQGGWSANSWVAKDALGRAYVEVAFEKTQEVKQIAIFENLNAGCVTRVMVGPASGKLKTVARKKRETGAQHFGWRQKNSVDRNFYFNRKRRLIEKAPEVNHQAEIDYYLLDAPVSGVKVVRVEFDFGLKPGQKQVDAIGISDSEVPIMPEISLLPSSTDLSPAEVFLYTKHQDEQLMAPFLLGEDLYYTVQHRQREGEIQRANVNGTQLPQEAGKAIRGNRNLHYLLGYAPESRWLLMGSEDKFIMGKQSMGFELLTYEPNGFNFLKSLEVTAYRNYGEYADAFLCADGKRILFGLESDLTQGGSDLYMSPLKEEGHFGLLQNLGKEINTAGEEISPFLLSDGKTLLFSSNGYAGYGDFDLYVSTRMDDTWKKWTTPRNLGPVVNGASFETNPVYDEKTETLYYLSIREGLSVIHKVKLPLALLGTKD